MCGRWPDHLRLESTLGELVRGRCKATNLCDYCAMLAGIENCYVLRRDAVLNSMPTLWTVLGTRTATLQVARFRGARTRVLRAVRDRWPDAEAAIHVEYTTGYGTHAGGQRRPHWNLVWKGIPVEDAEELHRIEVEAWLAAGVDATREAHAFERCVRVVNDMDGLGRYLADHLSKDSQRPPEGFKGHRFATTRGYLGMPLPQAREEARAEMTRDRERWKAQRAGLSGEAAEEAAEAAWYERSELAWNLVRLDRVPTAFDADGMPSEWADVVNPL